MRRCRKRRNVSGEGVWLVGKVSARAVTVASCLLLLIVLFGSRPQASLCKEVVRFCVWPMAMFLRICACSAGGRRVADGVFLFYFGALRTSIAAWQMAVLF